MHLYPRRRGNMIAFVTSAIASVVGLILLIIVLSGVSQSVGDEKKHQLQASLREACITCFATEGRYPMSLDYLTENYGVLVDEDHFIVQFDAFADNVMPVIDVLARGE